MNHIATVIYPSRPAPTTSALCDQIRAAFPEARMVEVDDGIELALETSGRLFIEIDDRTLEVLDGAGRPIAPPDPSAVWPDDAEAAELQPDAAPQLEGRVRDLSDGATAAHFAEATRYVHLGGDFADPADVIGLLQVLLRAAPDATATDAAGQRLLVTGA